MSKTEIKKALQTILAIAKDTTPKDFYGGELEPKKRDNFEAALANSNALANVKKQLSLLIEKIA